MVTQNSMKDSLIAFAQSRLERLEAQSLRRSLHPSARLENSMVVRGDKRLISFSDNDYLSLSQDPRVKEAAAHAALTYGAGAGASRLITGDNPLNAALEEHLAAKKGCEAALIFGSGYLANISTIPVLMRPGDLIVMDELAHNCMHMGARLSGAEIALFRHNDVADAASKLAQPATRKLLLTETVFSMDGDLAPLQDLAVLCEAQGAWLMSDDAHGLGIVETPNPAHIQMGTLSKAAGAYGGYICGPRALIDLLINRGRGLIFTTGLPPATLAAGLKALEIMAAEPKRRSRAMAHTAQFCKALGLPQPQSTIVPVIFGAAQAALDAAKALEDEGFLVTAIRPPTVPKDTARLRISFCTDHDEADVERLAQAVLKLRRRAA